MTVFVDDMRARFRRLILCHMVADTDAELHAMADRIGVARRWFQGDHYDIALSKRALALRAGAVPITQRECGIMTIHRRRHGVLMPLADVREFLAALAAAREEHARLCLWQPGPTP